MRLGISEEAKNKNSSRYRSITLTLKESIDYMLKYIFKQIAQAAFNQRSEFLCEVSVGLLEDLFAEKKCHSISSYGLRDLHGHFVQGIAEELRKKGFVVVDDKTPGWIKISW
jgi:hypothetical protein